MREHKRSQPVHLTHFRLRTLEHLMVVRVRDNAELPGNGEGVVIHDEGKIVAVLAGMPQPLVPGPPLSDRRVSLPLPHGAGVVDVADLDDADIGNLDQSDRESRRVDDYLHVAGARQRLGVSDLVYSALRWTSYGRLSRWSGSGP